MKFSIERAVFAKALSHVTRVVERRNTYPILANVVLAADPDGRLSLRATDLDIEITEPVTATVSEPGITTVPGHMLSEIIRKMPDGAEITFEETDHSSVVKAGRSRFNLAGLSPDSYPELKSGEFTHSFEIPAKDLARIIAKTAFAISTEETRFYLNGVYLHTVEDMGEMALRAVATDGHRLARCQCPAPDGAVGMPGIIVPRKTVGEIAKLIDGAETVLVEISTNKIRLTINQTVLTSKLIEGQFPDYQRVMPKENNKHAIVAKTELDKALDRVATMASERGGKAVKLTLAEGNLTLEVSNPDHGAATEEMAVQFDPSERMEIGFNAKYLADVLHVLDGDDVRLELKEAGDPALLRSDGDDGSFLAVLMPMRT